MLNTYVSKILSSVEHIYFMESTRNILFIRINERKVIILANLQPTAIMWIKDN